MPARIKTASVKKKRSAGRPRAEDIAEIESRLLSVALERFLRDGYGAASMAGIVKAAGVSKTTLYSRFASKGDLFRAIIRQQLEGFDPAAMLVRPGGRLDIEKGLKAYANRMLEASLQGEMRQVNRLIASESHRFPELGVAAAERMALGVSRIADFIRDCAAADGLRCQDPEGISEAFILMLRGWYMNVLMANQEVSDANRQRWVARAVRTILVARSEW